MSSFNFTITTILSSLSQNSTEVTHLYKIVPAQSLCLLFHTTSLLIPKSYYTTIDNKSHNSSCKIDARMNNSIFSCNSLPNVSGFISKSCMGTIDQWYRTLEHPNPAIQLKFAVIFIFLLGYMRFVFCEACQVEKMHQKPHITQPIKNIKPFQLVHFDLRFLHIFNLILYSDTIFTLQMILLGLHGYSL